MRASILLTMLLTLAHSASADSRCEQTTGWWWSTVITCEHTIIALEVAEDDYTEARALLDKIQEDWLEEVRQHPIPTMGQRFYERPTSFILTLIAIAAIIGLSVLPFLGAFE